MVILKLKAHFGLILIGSTNQVLLSSILPSFGLIPFLGRTSWQVLKELPLKEVPHS